MSEPEPEPEADAEPGAEPEAEPEEGAEPGLARQRSQSRHVAFVQDVKGRDESVKERELHAEMAMLEHSGWMLKKGQVRRGWSRRYFELSGDFLFYFEKKGGEKKGSIDLVSALDVRPSAYENETKRREFEIEVVVPDRTYRLDCETNAGAQGWLHSLAKFSADPEACRTFGGERAAATHDGTGRYLVLEAATVREKPDDKSTKLGRFNPDEVIEVVEQQFDDDGRARLKTATPPPGAKSGFEGGWLKTVRHHPFPADGAYQILTGAGGPGAGVAQGQAAGAAHRAPDRPGPARPDRPQRLLQSRRRF